MPMQYIVRTNVNIYTPSFPLEISQISQEIENKQIFDENKNYPRDAS